MGNQGYAQELYFQNHVDESFRRMYRFMKKYFVSSDKAGLAGVMDGLVFVSYYRFTYIEYPLIRENIGQFYLFINIQP